jgi:peroxiredoxin
MTDAANSLTQQFRNLHAERERTWDAEKLRRNVEQRRALVEAFDPDAVVQVGERLEPFTLEVASGGTLTLDELVADGAALLIFFRFAGCPACNLALPYYDRQLRPGLEAAGVRLVAVSPHLPEKGLDQIRVRHDLGFIVASDRGNALGRRFGITFEPDDTPAITDGDESWIGALTGTLSWELPQPAAVLIDRDRVVRFVDVSPDWLVRTEAEPILQRVGELAGKGGSIAAVPPLAA